MHASHLIDDQVSVADKTSCQGFEKTKFLLVTFQTRIEGGGSEANNCSSNQSFSSCINKLKKIFFKSAISRAKNMPISTQSCTKTSAERIRGVLF